MPLDVICRARHTSEAETALSMPVMRHALLQGAGSDDQVNRAAGDCAVQVFILMSSVELHCKQKRTSLAASCLVSF
jgi:hypothetical protein